MQILIYDGRLVNNTNLFSFLKITQYYTQLLFSHGDIIILVLEEFSAMSFFFLPNKPIKNIKNEYIFG